MSGPGFVMLRKTGLNVATAQTLPERMNLNFNADATNLLNNAQCSGAYNGGLGSTNLVGSGWARSIPEITMRLLLQF